MLNAIDKHTDLASLLERRVILELDVLTSADKTFLVEALLLWIHHYRLGHARREEFKHALIIEEAYHILLKRSAGRGGVRPWRAGWDWSGPLSPASAGAPGNLEFG